MKTITGTANAYLSPYTGLNADTLHEANVDQFTFWNAAVEVPNDYTLVGTAVITVKLIGRDAVINNKIKSLRQVLHDDRAESEVRQNRILKQINTLLAITHEVAA